MSCTSTETRSDIEFEAVGCMSARLGASEVAKLEKFDSTWLTLPWLNSSHEANEAIVGEHSIRCFCFSPICQLSIPLIRSDGIQGPSRYRFWASLPCLLRDSVICRLLLAARAEISMVTPGWTRIQAFRESKDNVSGVLWLTLTIFEHSEPCTADL